MAARFTVGQAADLLLVVLFLHVFLAFPSGGLRSGVERAREAGYAISHGEREVGVSAVAVPVVSRTGRVGSSLTISGPTARFTDDRIETFVTELKEVSAQMTRRGFTHPFES